MTLVSEFCATTKEFSPAVYDLEKGEGAPVFMKFAA